jgi:hypothetical protein
MRGVCPSNLLGPASITPAIGGSVPTGGLPEPRLTGEQMHTVIVIVTLVVAVGPTIMVLAGTYMLVSNRVPPPERVWGAGDRRTGAVLVRPRLLGAWLIALGGVSLLLVVMSLVAGTAVILGIGGGICFSLMNLGLNSPRFAKLRVPPGAYRPRPDRGTSPSSAP